MKFATYVMVFGQEKWIMRNLENAYSHVDQIYVCYPHFPWGYNPDARKTYINTFDLNIIKQSKYMDKITIIEGDWELEIPQRNACLERAKKDGVDFLMVHDADEFYFHDDFEKLKEEIQKHPNFDSYILKLCVFWKSFKYILISPKIDNEYINETFYAPGGKISGIAETVLNLHKDIVYDKIRLTNAYNRMMIKDTIYYHGSYVLTNEEVLKKIQTWGHNKDFDPEKWYQEKWLNWTLESQDLHPMYPNDWTHAEIYNEELPEVIQDLKN